MGLDFKLYEVTNHKDVEIHTEHILEKVLELSNTTAMLITEWFYNKNGRILHDSIRENMFFIECSGNDLIEIIQNLELIFNEEDEYTKKLLALNYFPTTYNSNYYVTILEMFSERYFVKLGELYDSLRKVMPNDSISNQERLFFYNISW